MVAAGTAAVTTSMVGLLVGVPPSRYEFPAMVPVPTCRNKALEAALMVTLISSPP